MNDTSGPEKKLSRDERVLIAAGVALSDADFWNKLIENGCPKSLASSLIKELSQKYFNWQVNCTEIRQIIRQKLKEKYPKACELALTYRRKLKEWVIEQSSDVDPPHFVIQNIPPVTRENLSQYFDLIKESGVIPGEDYHPLGKVSKEMRINFQKLKIGNLQDRICKFIQQSEQNALAVLVYMIESEDDELVDALLKAGLIFKETIKKLSANLHFVRSLINIIEEIPKPQQNKKEEDRRANVVLFNAFKALVDLGICKEVSEYPVRDATKPDEEGFWYMQYRDNKEEVAELLVFIPQKYIPYHWNSHRIVIPSINDTFHEVAAKLDEAPKLDGQLNEEDLDKYTNSLINNRRYALDFDRMKITEIPGTNGMDIWMHFFHHVHMQPGEIGIELIVNGASIVYFLNEKCELKVPEKSIVLPRPMFMPKDPEKLKDGYSMDQIYTCPESKRDWISERAQKILHFYFVKYAYYLLCVPRHIQTDEKNTDSKTTQQHDKKQNQNNKFDIRLTEYSSEITIPSIFPNGTADSGRESRITVYHGVTGHVRELPERYRATEEAIAEAKKHKIVLAPGQTFVKPHMRGGQHAEEIKSKKKIKPD